AAPPGNRARLAVSPIEEASTFLEIPVTEMAGHSRAFVKIQEGCDESCSFCIIPQTRGRSRSREPARVLAQVRTLLEGGYREVVLTGVHLGDYGRDLPCAERLLEPLVSQLLALPGLARLRLSSIEPASVGDELVGLMAAEPRFARHFHIPLQSASDDVLARMRRRYTRADFVRLVEDIATRVPGCSIGTDVICGFPGESDDDFRRTFDTLAALPVAYLHPFTYSARPGSAAESFGDAVPGEVAKRRTRALKRLSADKARDFRAAHAGADLEVLVEQPRGGVAIGLSDNFLRVRLPGGATPGDLLRVRVTGEHAGELTAEPL
ncbi:MAG: MiaB/RimO family radical SAM methylthiotransferase, partial [Planctomycetes bacterium]|nr:MiaB/RimO family radical SAM methylthiotransferase [Planctomycetota bacterium]